MPVLNFQLRSHSHVRNTASADLVDLTQARLEASRRVGDLLKEHAAEVWADEDWQMDVTDESGLIIFVISISAHGTSATVGHNRTKTE